MTRRPPAGGLRSWIAIVAVAMTVLAGCAGPHAGVEPGSALRDGSPASIALRLIGERTFDHRLQFGGTTVGGLSGIDYDPVDDLYYLISDDRSWVSPARFYTARLTIDEHAFTDASLQSVVTLLTPDGTPFPAASRTEVADGEAIRFDTVTRTLLWASEGERSTGRKVDPFVRRATLDGRHLATLPLDPMFRVNVDGRGPRDNRVFEGLSLSSDRRALYVSMEGPLLQDGPMPTREHGAWSRISRLDRTTDGFGPLAAQFAYPIDPVPDVFAITTFKSLNSVSEILALDERRMLVLERALVLGSGWRVRLFEADFAGATDVRSIDALGPIAGSHPFTPMTKRLVLDLNTLPVLIDNLEGLCFGPPLPNGHRTLVMVSDDNFNPGEKTQLLVFEIIPR